MEKIQIEWPAKPITHAFLQFTDSERDKYIMSANMLKRESTGRKRRISPAKDAEERFIKQEWLHQVLHSYKTQCTAREDHDEPCDKARVSRGQTVIRTCANGSHQYQDVKTKVRKFTDKWLTKSSSQRL